MLLCSMVPMVGCGSLLSLFEELLFYFKFLVLRAVLRETVALAGSTHDIVVCLRLLSKYIMNDGNS